MQETDIVIERRAEVLAELLTGENAGVDGRRSIEQAKRVAQAVKTEPQRTITWLEQSLSHEAATGDKLVGLGFDISVVDAAETLRQLHGESVLDHAKRIASNENADLVAVARAKIDDRINEGIEQRHEALAAYTQARNVLARAAAALAREQTGEMPPAGGIADDRPTAPGLRNALNKLDYHSRGALETMRQMMRGPGDEPWEVRARLSMNDIGRLARCIQELMVVAGMFIIDLTARDQEDTYKERMTLDPQTKDTSPMQRIEASARTIMRRVRDFNEMYGDEQADNGKVH